MIRRLSCSDSLENVTSVAFTESICKEKHWPSTMVQEELGFGNFLR